MAGLPLKGVRPCGLTPWIPFTNLEQKNEVVMPSIMINSHNIGDGAPYPRGNNRLGSSNPIVQKAMHSQDHSDGETRRLLQKELSLNPSKEMVNFFSNLDSDDKKDFLRVWKVLRGTLSNKAMATLFGLIEDQNVIKQKGREVGKLKNDLDATINKANGEIDQIKGALSDLTEKLKNTVSSAQVEVSQSIKDIRDNAEGAITSFITSHTASVEEIESRIKESLTKATVTTLSSKYDEKRKILNVNYWCAKGFFYACLCAFCIIGLLAVHNVSVMAGDDIVAKIVKTMLTNAPYYLPLFWFTCHMNKLMNQNRRLMEEYAHKVAVAQTYVGMAEQVEELSKKGVKDANDLSAELMDDTIKALCANPNQCLDKVRSSTPISEVVDSVSKLMRATAELKRASEK